MFGTKSFARFLAGAVMGLAGLAAVGGSASATVLTIEDVGFVAPTATNTLVQRVDLTTAGTPTINSIILRDISGGVGGSPGIFSGYDLDAVFLDGDGNIATTGDQIAFSSLAFTGGMNRPTGDVNQMSSNLNDYGEHFGTNFAGNITTFGGGSKSATLGTFDGISTANRVSANGFLSLGDGGVVVLTFADILVGDSLYLIFGEVGGQGEKLQVEVSQVPLPGAVWLLLSAIAALFGASRRRSAATA